MAMKTQDSGPVLKKPGLGNRALESWNRFWFTPADPTVLGLIRICCGVMTLYTALTYSLDLQDFFGKDGWWNLEYANRIRHKRPNQVGPLRGYEPPPTPQTDFQIQYVNQYKEFFNGENPPAPFPKNFQEEQFSFNFRNNFGFDFRLYHMPFPQDKKEAEYIFRFVKKWNLAPAPPYPKNKAEEDQINDYIAWHGIHPAAAYARGKPIWSIWFHVTDPAAMAVVHGAICLVTFLFMIGFCTRITTVLTWLGQLSYIHRTTQILFGVDTMMTILLLYLMIGPSGSAFSVDRLIARWWRRSKERIISRWRRFLGKPLGEIAAAPLPSLLPEPSVSANVAIRLLQIHVCIIYLAAGLAKMLGRSWWDGTAVWYTLANYEFAPMQFEIYNNILRTLGKNWMVLYAFLTAAGYFTLFFEIGYAFLIWRPATRWLLLSMAIVLHGMIGLFMGLKTFSLMMLVMNMAFLRPEEVRWFFSWFSRGRKELIVSGPSGDGPVLATAGPSTAVKRKK
jgi:hypothetical protein